MKAIDGIGREEGRRVAQVLTLEDSSETAERSATLSGLPGGGAPINLRIPRMLAVGALVTAIGTALVISQMFRHGAVARGSLKRADESRGLGPELRPGVPPVKDLKTSTLSWTFAPAASIAAALAGTSHAQQAVQWRVENGGNGHWYAIDPTNRDWIVAKALAESKGGHLATPTSLAENQFVTQLTIMQGIQGDFWLGGYRSDESCSPPCMQWVTGEPWSYSNWGPGGPPVDSWGCWAANPNGCGWNGPGTGLALELVRRDGQSGVWNDETPGLYYNGNIIGAPAIFEWSADCNGDGLVDYGQILSGQLADSDNDGTPNVCECTCDVFRDNAVNGIDLGVLLGQWGPANQFTVTDFNSDGAVDGTDLGTLLAAWGPCPG